MTFKPSFGTRIESLTDCKKNLLRLLTTGGSFSAGREMIHKLDELLMRATAGELVISQDCAFTTEETLNKPNSGCFGETEPMRDSSASFSCVSSRSTVMRSGWFLSERYLRADAFRRARSGAGYRKRVRLEIHGGRTTEIDKRQLITSIRMMDPAYCTWFKKRRS